MINKKLIVLLSIFGGIALIIILSSVIFAVHTVSASCVNDIDTALDSQVVESADADGASIFFLDEDAIVDKVDSSVVNAEMISITKIFPNKILLNYNKLYNDIVFKVNNKEYLSSASGKIQSIDTDSADCISVVLGGTPTSLEVGSYFNDKSSDDIVALDTIINELYRLEDTDGNQVIYKNAFESIDLSGADVVITTSTGARFELYCNPDTNERADSDKILEQLAVAVSMYIDDDCPKTGTYTVTYTNMQGSYIVDN